MMESDDIFVENIENVCESVNIPSAEQVLKFSNVTLLSHSPTNKDYNVNKNEVDQISSEVPSESHDLEDISSDCTSASVDFDGPTQEDLESISSESPVTVTYNNRGNSLDEFYENIDSDLDVIDNDFMLKSGIEVKKKNSFVCQEDLFEDIISSESDNFMKCDDLSDLHSDSEILVNNNIHVNSDGSDFTMTSVKPKHQFQRDDISCLNIVKNPNRKRLKNTSDLYDCDNPVKIIKQCNNGCETDYFSVESFTSDSHNKYLSRNIAFDSTEQISEAALSNSRNETTKIEHPQKKNLRVFDVLDEAGDSEEERAVAFEHGFGQSSSDSEIPEEEIDAMLEEGLTEMGSAVNKKIKNEKPDENDDSEADVPQPYYTTEKVVLIDKGRTPFDILPEGWIQVTHNSGMPVYLHKGTRVCTLSRPYFLGTGSTRKHNVPISAIPCLQYLREIDKENALKNNSIEPTEVKNCIKNNTNDMCYDEKKLETEIQDNDKSVCVEKNSGGQTNYHEKYSVSDKEGTQIDVPQVSVEVKTAADHQAECSLSPEEVHEYCKKRFLFNTLQLRKFKSWLERRKFYKIHEKKARTKTLSFPADTKIITLPVLQNTNGTNCEKKNRKWILNPRGKSHVCILHEYVQRTLKSQVSYSFSSTQNPSKPYSATIKINDIKYGSGIGSSKREAKAAAARVSLEILIPNYKDILPESEETSSFQHSADLSVKNNMFKKEQIDIYPQLFDQIAIEDVRVPELSMKTSEPLPYNVLVTCLQRNFCPHITDIKKHIHVEMRTLKHQKNEFVMSVGKHTSQVMCKNKKEGKQLAAQAILQALHPHIDNWGSLLRLYGKESVCGKSSRHLDREITSLQNQGSTERGPNHAILAKLKEEMLWIKRVKDSCLSIGQFTLPDSISLPLSGGLNLDNMDII